jgi:hypothetical protein
MDWDSMTYDSKTFRELMDCKFEPEKQGKICKSCDRVRKCNCPVVGKVPEYVDRCNHFRKSK